MIYICATDLRMKHFTHSEGNLKTNSLIKTKHISWVEIIVKYKLQKKKKNGKIHFIQIEAIVKIRLK